MLPKKYVSQMKIGAMKINKKNIDFIIPPED
jgi:hypothetical protein